MAKARLNTVRIIGGQWRGRRLPVQDQDSLRPTKDIIRETLFNWLQPILPGSRCLDAFAGSGALGFEAASRNAKEVVMLEPARNGFDSLRKQVAVLQAEQWVQPVCTRAELYLQQNAQPFDIIFLDPPFQSAMLGDICALLHNSQSLHKGSKIYLEAARTEGLPTLPETWCLSREKTSGDVIFGLAECE